VPELLSLDECKACAARTLMRDILPHLDDWQGRGEEIAVATVIRVRGSAPRPVGSRLIVSRSGCMAGSVSGGCVESDVFERALRVLETGRPELVRYDAADETELHVGLACGGSIDVLIEGFAETEAWRAARAAQARRERVALCVAVDPESLRGSQLVVAADGAVVGSIAADLDARLATEALEQMAAPRAATYELPLRDGVARVLIETFLPPPRLFIVGATHIAIPLCRLAKELGYRICVIDPRPIFATEERFADADELVRAWPDEAFEKVELDEDSHVVTLAHDVKFDLPALAIALRSDVAYVGALGSRVTHERRLEQLREQGFGAAELAKIRTPVGLDLGGRTPEEIALSILSEIVATRHGREGGPLIRRRAPIHDAD
jgi:xanthine dehydrogenase accessory factor